MRPRWPCSSCWTRRRQSLSASPARRTTWKGSITDTASGAKAARPGLDKVREFLRAGDTLVVWRLDRLGRSLKDLIASVA